MEGKKGRGGRVKGGREDAGRKGVVVWEEKRHEVLANHIWLIQQSQTTALLHAQCRPSGHVSRCR